MKIANRFLAMMIILGLMIIGGLFWTTHYVIIPWHIETMSQKARELASYIEKTTPLLSEAQMQKHLTQIQGEQADLSYILLVDRNGKALFHSDPYRVGMVFDDQGTLAAAREGKTVEQIYIRDADNPQSNFHGERILDILVPYYNNTNSLAGAVNVGLSLKSIDLATKRYYTIISINAFLFLSFLIFLTYKHVKDVISPLSSIAEMARRFGEGNPDHTIRINRNDEIGILAAEFNKMSQNISNQILERNRTELELRASYEELTATNEELVASNEELIAVEEELKLSYEEINKSHTKISNLLESIEDGFCSLDSNFKITYLNSEAEMLLHISKDEILVREWWAAFSDIKSLSVFSELQRVLEEKSSAQFETYNNIICKWLEFRAYLPLKVCLFIFMTLVLGSIQKSN
ncbi:hypothetical protein N752_16520 [Desulforamulus aquiferis]|nr:HAMP domain-containing protein [Desulforamulus aquiferis]RYD03994.1 hypothetical protein N752_16520 [Desulforamulus aquiferis]